ncbi:MAG: hypothetical protein ACFCVD_05825 [Nodosilinea sp.]
MVYPIASLPTLSLPFRITRYRFSAPSLSQLRHPRLWGLGLGSLALGLTNGGLVISLGLGLLAYRQLRQLPPAQRQALQRRMQLALPLPLVPQHYPLVLSALLAASLYTMITLWHSTHSFSMAMVLTGQTALLLWIGLLLRFAGSAAESSPGPVLAAHRPAPEHTAPPPVPLEQFEQTLTQLSHSDPLQRLVAVRQLFRLVDQSLGDQCYLGEVSVQSHLLDCLHLMLAHEPEPIVRTAVREGLPRLQRPAQLTAGLAPLAPVDSLQPVSKRQGQRPAVEYIDYLEA